MLENLYLALAKHHKKTKETRGKVGLRAGITESRLSMIVHGKADATPKERKALSKALDVNEGYLFAQGPEQQTAAKG